MHLKEDMPLQNSAPQFYWLFMYENLYAFRQRRTPSGIFNGKRAETRRKCFSVGLPSHWDENVIDSGRKRCNRATRPAERCSVLQMFQCHHLIGKCTEPQKQIFLILFFCTLYLIANNIFYSHLFCKYRVFQFRLFASLLNLYINKNIVTTV